MKKLYILITLCSPLLLTVSCKTILQKDKYSELNQTLSKLESTHNSQKLKSSDKARNNLLIQNDSLNYWAWIQSSGFFHYHPETGFIGENGEIWISGNQKIQRREESNSLESEIQLSDSSNKEHSSNSEKNKTKEESQTSNSRNTMWRIVGGAGLMLLLMFIFNRRMKSLV